MSKKTLHYHGTNTGNYDWVWRDMDGLVIVGNHLHHDRRTDGRTRENLFFWWSDSEIIEERLVLCWVSSWKSSKSQCPPPPCPVLRLPRSYKPIESVIDSFWQIRFTARCWSAFCIWRCAPWIVVDGVEPDRLAGTHKWDNGKVRKKKKSHLFAEWLQFAEKIPCSVTRSRRNFVSVAQLSRQGHRRLLIVLFPETESLTGVSYKRAIFKERNSVKQVGTSRDKSSSRERRNVACGPFSLGFL